MFFQIHGADTTSARKFSMDYSSRYRGNRELVTGNFVFVVEELRKRLQAERDRLAEGVFHELLKCDEMRFMVVADDLGFDRLPKKLKSRREKNARRGSMEINSCSVCSSTCRKIR